MTDHIPLNFDGPDSAVNVHQGVTVFETPAHQYPKHGAIMIQIHESKSHNTLVQISEQTARSLRNQLNAILPADDSTQQDGLERHLCVCGKKITLTKAGVFRHHRGDERDYKGSPWKKVCAGAGKKP